MKATRRITKRGALLDNEILEVILAAVGIFLLIVLFWKLIAPSFDRDKETAKSYFETLKQEIAKADGGGEFMIWQGDNIYLVYFGNSRRIDYTVDNKPQFSFLKTPASRTICVCGYYKEKFNCYDSCMSLASVNDENTQWFVGKGEKIYINKINGKLYFTTEKEREVIQQLEKAGKLLEELRKKEITTENKVFYISSLDAGTYDIYFNYLGSWKFAILTSDIEIDKLDFNYWWDASSSRANEILQDEAITTNRIYTPTIAKFKDIIASLEGKSLEEGKEILLKNNAIAYKND